MRSTTDRDARVAATREEGAPAPELVYVIGRVNQGIEREMRERLAPYELSVPDYTALSVLRARPGLSNAQLSRRSMITPQSMIQVLASLEERGLIERKAVPEHGRILRAELTRRGRRTLESAEPAILAMQEQILADVPSRHREIVLGGLLSAMAKLTGGLERDPS